VSFSFCFSIKLWFRLNIINLVNYKSSTFKYKFGFSCRADGILFPALRQYFSVVRHGMTQLKTQGRTTTQRLLKNGFVHHSNATQLCQCFFDKGFGSHLFTIDGLLLLMRDKTQLAISKLFTVDATF